MWPEATQDVALEAQQKDVAAVRADDLGTLSAGAACEPVPETWCKPRGPSRGLATTRRARRRPRGHSGRPARPRRPKTQSRTPPAARRRPRERRCRPRAQPAGPPCPPRDPPSPLGHRLRSTARVRLDEERDRGRQSRSCDATRDSAAASGAGLGMGTLAQRGNAAAMTSWPTDVNGALRLGVASNSARLIVPCGSHAVWPSPVLRSPW